MGFDIARVRGLFPGLGDGWVHFDAQAGMRVPESVAATVAVAMRTAVSAPGGSYPSSQRGQAITDGARAAIADLVGANAAGVVLGAGRAVLLERLADALSARLTLGTEVVVSRLDAHDNTAPWRRVARQRGAAVRWAEIDIETCELPEWQYADLIGEATKVVAVTAASGSLGTCPDVRAIAERAHAVGALVVVDATAIAPFAPLDIDALGADVLVVSSAEWGGPPLAALAFGIRRCSTRCPPTPPIRGFGALRDWRSATTSIPCWPASSRPWSTSPPCVTSIPLTRITARAGPRAVSACWRRWQR